MAKVITDEAAVGELITRGVEKIYPDRDALKKELMSGRRLRLYCGFDPSAPSLHIGNAIAINKLAQFQALGHELIFLIGDFTGMIGDPTDKSAVRAKLTREQVRENCRNYQDQASAYLDFEGENRAVLRYNSEWSDKVTFRDLIELSSHFTVQQMIQRDMFQKRIAEEKPIYLHEFLYPLAQGYDSLVMDVDLEVGGNDQMFNMMAGRHLMQALGKKNKFVLTLQLLADDAGKKMGKSEGNAVFLNQEPKDMFGAVMSWTDGAILPGFELATKVSRSVLEETKQRLAGGENPRNLKMELAYELVCLVHGEEAAQGAKEDFVAKFQNKEIPDDLPEMELSSDINLIEALLKAGFIASKSEARRMISQGGVKVDGETIKDVEYIIRLSPEGVVLQKGKRQFVRVIGKK